MGRAEATEEEKNKTECLTYVAKFGGSSLASADRLREVYKLIDQAYISQKDRPVIVLSAMGKTTNNLLEAGNKALKEGVVDISKIEDLTYDTIKELELDAIKEEIDELIVELKSLLTGVTMLKELSPRSRDYLVSFGERISTRLFAEFCRKQGQPAT